MKTSVVAALGATALVGFATAENHPIANLIKFFELSIENGKNEAIAEADQFKKFTHWCKTEASTFARLISDGQKKIAVLTDESSALDAGVKSGTVKQLETTTKVDQLGTQLNELDTSAETSDGTWEAKERALEDTIKAIGDALAMLKAAKCTLDSANSTSLLATGRGELEAVAMLASPKLSRQEIDMLEVFAGRDAPLVGSDASTVDVRNGTTHVMTCDAHRLAPVVEIVKNLEKDYTQQKVEAEKAYNNEQNNLAVTLLAAKQEHGAAETLLMEVSSKLINDQKALESAQADLDVTKTDLATNQADQASTDSVCKAKTTEFGERSKIRGEETVAMHKVIEVLGEITGVRTAVTETSASQGSAFVQLASRQQSPREVAAALVNQAAQLKKASRVSEMTALASKIREGPFDQIRNMIQKMIFQLNKEQTDEATHKHWCDQELETSAKKEETKNTAFITLGNKVDTKSSTIDEVTTQMETSQGEVQNAIEHIKTETEIRETDKKENAIDLKDAQDAQGGLAQAMAIMHEFYEKSGEEVSAFLQVTNKEAPKVWDSEFTAATSGNMVLELLEQTSESFAQMEVESKVTEQQQQTAYDDDMSKTMLARDDQKKEAELAASRLSSLEKEKSELAANKKTVGKELEAVQIYLKDLAPGCQGGDSSYDARKAARDSEIAALKSAEVTLKDAFGAGAFLQVRRHRFAPPS